MYNIIHGHFASLSVTLFNKRGEKHYLPTFPPNTSNINVVLIKGCFSHCISVVPQYPDSAHIQVKNNTCIQNIHTCINASTHTNSPVAQRPRNEMNIASGCPIFAPLSVINNSSYVKDDTMFLKCETDISGIIP